MCRPNNEKKRVCLTGKLTNKTVPSLSQPLGKRNGTWQKKSWGNRDVQNKGKNRAYKSQTKEGGLKFKILKRERGEEQKNPKKKEAKKGKGNQAIEKN